MPWIFIEVKFIPFAYFYEAKAFQLFELVTVSGRRHTNFFLDRLRGERKLKVRLVGCEIDVKKECLCSEGARRVFPVIVIDSEEIAPKRRAMDLD